MDANKETAEADARPYAPAWRLLVIDETRYWELPEYPGVRVETVYLYNANEAVHCCELTPSYWLVEVETRAILPTEETDWSYDDPRHDTLAMVIDENKDWQGMYMHCHHVDRMRTVAVGWDADPDATTEEDAEAVEKYCRCNQLA